MYNVIMAKVGEKIGLPAFPCIEHGFHIFALEGEDDPGRSYPQEARGIGECVSVEVEEEVLVTLLKNCGEPDILNGMMPFNMVSMFALGDPSAGLLMPLPSDCDDIDIEALFSRGSELHEYDPSSLEDDNEPDPAGDLSWLENEED